MFGHLQFVFSKSHYTGIVKNEQEKKPPRKQGGFVY